MITSMYLGYKSPFGKLPSFFKDKHGHVVLWQAPNLALYGWIIFMLLGHVLHNGHARTASQHLATAFIFTWAFLEVTSGVNYFRRAIGLAVLVLTIIGFLN